MLKRLTYTITDSYRGARQKLLRFSESNMSQIQVTQFVNSFIASLLGAWPLPFNLSAMPD